MNENRFITLLQCFVSWRCSTSPLRCHFSSVFVTTIGKSTQATVGCRQLQNNSTGPTITHTPALPPTFLQPNHCHGNRKRKNLI